MASLVNESDWKQHAKRHEHGYLSLETEDLGGVPVRLFLSDELLTNAEPGLYRQIVNATRFHGVKLVVITPDVHVGYGVPVGSVIVTDGDDGAIAMGPVGYDIGCGMISAESSVSAERATPDRRLAFNREVSERVSLGTGGESLRLGRLSEREVEAIARGGAEYYGERFGAGFDRHRAERHRLPVDDDWEIPWGGRGKPERGVAQLGTLGGGNHFIELQRDERNGTLCVQIHTGSRGFGHGLATNYFDLSRDERPEAGRDIDLGYFTPESPQFAGYLNAVAAGANYAIVNRLIIYEAVAEAFHKVFREDLTLTYEISHNLVQAEEHPELGRVWVHRKGATRAFPAGHPALAGSIWERTGHPVLIPGSNRDKSYILMPEAGAVNSAYSVNHGAGRRMSRGEATRRLDQQLVNRQYAEAGIVVNLDGEVPLDESAQCYKSADEVVGVVVAAGLARVDRVLDPLASLKGDDGRSAYKKRRGERKQRDRARERERDEARRQKRGN